MAAELFSKPRITATDVNGKFDQFIRYFNQFIDQLNWAFNALPGAGLEAHDTKTGNGVTREG